MNNFFRSLAVLACMTVSSAFACVSPATICSQSSEGSFALISNGYPVSVMFETTADPAVQRVAKTFAEDLERVSGRKSKLIGSSEPAVGPAVLVGVLGQSALIDGLVDSGKLNIDKLAGEWEAYRIAVVSKPWPEVDSVLVIVGSDRRGAIYGTYDVSEKLGISPWYWFADVPVTMQSQVYITAGARGDQPKVRYRGFFINDEDPALSGWAKKRFGGVNADMYEHVFELMLRLKGNYLWPAMWSKAFHVDDPRNTVLADEMGIVIGSSHHEPMTRAHAEWHRAPDDPSIGGPWNYFTNAQNLRKFWRGGIERMMSKGDKKGYDSLVTVGMRGDGDEPMAEGTAIRLLETVVEEQRKIIAEVTGKPASETPQVWALYKEVQDYYDQGMTVPDDVTLLFSDDNWGQIRRLPTKGLDRSGGYGVYYHFDYVGAPRNYKWTNTIQIAKVWQQMNLAYERGAHDIWVVNVGDIKPVEYPLDFFMKMAWNPEAMTADNLEAYPQVWALKTFGAILAPEIAEIISRYSRYAARRKPELINETTFAIGAGTALELNRGEFFELVELWQTLVHDMDKIKHRIKPEQYAAFFQLVEYPIASLANLYEMYFSIAWNRRLATHHDARANHFLDKAEKAFARDTELTKQYHTIKDGKWDGMMNQVHMNYVIWNSPTQQTMPSVTRVVDGSNNIDVVFAPKPLVDTDLIELDASAYDRAIGGAGLIWKVIRNLGQSRAAMIALPQGRPATTVEEGIRLEYKFDLKSTGNIKVALHLSPTLDTLSKEGIRIGISLGDGPVKTVTSNLMPTSGAIRNPEQQAWSDAVTNNSHVVETEFKKVSSGNQVLKIWRLDDNVVLEKVEISSQ